MQKIFNRKFVSNYGPILVGLELFGGEYFGCFVLVCAASYLCNGGHSIYPQAKS